MICYFSQKMMCGKLINFNIRLRILFSKKLAINVIYQANHLTDSAIIKKLNFAMLFCIAFLQNKPWSRRWQIFKMFSFFCFYNYQLPKTYISFIIMQYSGKVAADFFVVSLNQLGSRLCIIYFCPIPNKQKPMFVAFTSVNISKT